MRLTTLNLAKVRPSQDRADQKISYCVPEETESGLWGILEQVSEAGEGITLQARGRRTIIFGTLQGKRQDLRLPCQEAHKSYPVKSLDHTGATAQSTGPLARRRLQTDVPRMKPRLAILRQPIEEK
jgi:hypothetical protein